MHRTLFATLLASLLVVAAAGCEKEPCPPGQVEYDGECVDVIRDATDLGCGYGTTPVDGVCRPDPDVVCGPGTEVVFEFDEQNQPTGNFYCQGTGSGALPPECPAPTPGGPICLNGYIRYLIDPEDPAKILETLAQFDSPTLKVVVYDPLSYATNPNTPPLGVGEVIPADGTFRVENVAVPGTGFLALVVEDDDSTGADDFVFTGFAYKGAAGVNLEGIDAYTVTATQNTAWSTAIGMASYNAANCQPGGTNESLYHCGTWVGVFGYGSSEEGFTFIEGVTPEKFAGPAVIAPDRVWYLGLDHDSFVPGTTQNYTNATGIAFHPGARLGNYTGICAAGTSCETDGYTWDQVNGYTGGAAANAIFVQLMEPEGFE